MNCQKCGAININEAVFCGICGARLKHQKVVYDFTGYKHVQSSVQRDDSRQSHIKNNHNHDTSSKKNIPPPLNTRLSKKQTSLKVWQDQFKNTFPKKNKVNKKTNIIPLVIAALIFAPPLFKIVSEDVIPYFLKQMDIALSNQNEQAVEEGNVAEEGESSEVIDAVASAGSYTDIQQVIQPRYMDVLTFQKYVEEYYEKYKKMPKDIHEIEKFRESIFSDFVYDDIEIHDGNIVGKFQNDPDKKIYLFHQVDMVNNRIAKWHCYSVGIKDEILEDCKYLDQDIFVK
nr:zinc ribbon domain-containing protein [Acinetobacter sp. Marseille-Q1620]